MESLQQRREELERKEQQLKDSLLKFDKFLKVRTCTYDVIFIHNYMYLCKLHNMITQQFQFFTCIYSLLT